MTSEVRFVDQASREDLQVFLERLQQAAQPEVRVVTSDEVLAVFGCTQAPATLTEPLPTVLVTRAFKLASLPERAVDEVVMVRALLDRMARLQDSEVTLSLPETTLGTSWAGVLPPRGGWQLRGAVDAASLEQVAKEGAARISGALPDNPGEALVRKVRAEIWGIEVAPGVPAAAAFAAESMGFLRDESNVLLAETSTWLRLKTSRGQVAVRKLWSPRDGATLVSDS